MGNLLAEGSAWLASQLKLHAATPVTYRRGSASVEIAATIGKTVFQVEDAQGLLTNWESRDYLVLAADLVLSGAVVLPQAGDRIAEPAGTKVLLYEVMAPGKEPVWRYSDAYRNALRVHTKFIGTEDAP